jgi:hypothetical protein
MKLLAMADSIEEAMCEAGYRTDTAVIRPANEARFEARWRLGQLLGKVERDKGGRPGKNSSRTGMGYRRPGQDAGAGLHTAIDLSLSARAAQRQAAGKKPRQ